MKFSLALAALVAAPGALAHMRFKCPAARNTNTGLKVGPCGSQGVGAAARVALSPGWQTITIEESISHTGAPFRLALAPSNNGREDEDVFETCVLLDHFPHHDNPTPAPSLGTDATYVPYHVAVFIPDINCPECTLQVVNPMTDKVNGKCTFEPKCDARGNCNSNRGECHSVYHSCADVSVAGTGSVAAFDCAASRAEAAKWPFTGTKDKGDEVYLSGESAPYEGTGWISPAAKVPAQFYTKAGPCAGTVPEPPVAGAAGTPAAGTPTATPAGTPIPIAESSSADYIASLSGDQEVPTVASVANGLMAISIDEVALKLTLHLYHTSTSPTAIHLHGPASVGANGPAMLTIAPDAQAASPPTVGTATIDTAFIDDLKAGKVYINVHSQVSPNGELRGQVFPVATTGTVVTPLDASAAVVAAGPPALPTGIAMLHLDSTTRRVSATVYHTVGDADKVVLGSRADASLQIQLATTEAEARTLPVQFTTRSLTESEERAFRSGAFTVTVASATYPDGAVSGQASAPTEVIKTDERLNMLNAAAAANANAGTTTTTTSGGKTNGAAIAFAVIGWLGLVGVAVGAAWWYFTKRLPAQRLKEEQFQLGVA